MACTVMIVDVILVHYIIIKVMNLLKIIYNASYTVHSIKGY